MATIAHKFKRELMTYDHMSQCEILNNMRAEALKQDETGFYCWVNQLWFIRTNTVDDWEFADNRLWKELVDHLETSTLQKSVATL